MNVKKSFQSHIRGWFPQEPQTTNTRLKGLKVELEKKRPPLTIPAYYKLSATKFVGALAIFWAVGYGYINFVFPNFKNYPSSPFEIIAWIIAGSIIGIISSALYTKRQFSRLLDDYQYSINGKDLALRMVPITLLIIFGFSVNLSTASQGLLFSVYAWGVCDGIATVALFAFFEKKEKMRIMQGWFGGELVLIPKPPNSNVHRSEKAFKIESSSLARYLSRNKQSKISKTKKFIIVSLLILAVAVLAVFIYSTTLPLPTPIPYELVNGNITVKIGSYEYYNFTVPPNDNAQIGGSFSVSNESTVKVSIFDEANFARFQTRLLPDAIYYSGKLTAANVTVTLRAQGTYYLVFDNSFGSTEENVETNISEYVYPAQLFR